MVATRKMTEEAKTGYHNTGDPDFREEKEEPSRRSVSGQERGWTSVSV